MKVVPFIYKDIDDVIANTYLVIDSSNNCFCIDPSVKYDGIKNYIKKNDLNLKGVLLTHGHFDHMRGVELLLNEFNIPLYIGFADELLLKDPYLNCSDYFGSQSIKINVNPIVISDQEVIHGLDEDIIVIATPYHTAGSVCYYRKESKILFSGDSLFKAGFGRDDLPNSVPQKRKDSISKILNLPEDVKVYPGHGQFTTIKAERILNHLWKNNNLI